MAQIENIARHHSGSSRKHILMDLTPIVDLGFLLISFFMVSTIISQPKSADLVMPKDSKDNTLVKESNVLTLMPVRNDRVDYFDGKNESAGTVKHCDYSELRSVINKSKEK